jgi:type IV secretory pathway TraG/TraD family ATPase VirD4
MPETRLGSAHWETPDVVSTRYLYTEGKFWLGRDVEGSPLGYCDDRHICLVSGTRGGKGTSVIVNNLCLWPGSAVVVDPKGENATVTADRRGKGFKWQGEGLEGEPRTYYSGGLHQAVHVLDPFMAAERR